MLKRTIAVACSCVLLSYGNWHSQPTEDTHFGNGKIFWVRGAKFKNARFVTGICPCFGRRIVIRNFSVGNFRSGLGSGGLFASDQRSLRVTALPTELTMQMPFYEANAIVTLHFHVAKIGSIKCIVVPA